MSTFKFADLKYLSKNDYHDSSSPNGMSPCISAAAHWIAAPTSRGSVGFYPVNHTTYDRKATLPTVSAHGTLLDLAWNPFDHNVLATGGDGGSVKIWNVPSGDEIKTLTTASSSVSMDGGDVNSLHWHPTSSGIIGAGLKNALSVVDVEAGQRVYNITTSGYGKDYIAARWNGNGSALGSLRKDGVLAIIDPRGSDSFDESDSKTFVKLVDNNMRQPQHLIFLGIESTGPVVVFGLNKTRRPVYHVYDQRNVASPIKQGSLSFSPGTLIPAYDVDTNLLFVGSKGSNTVHVYDVTNDSHDIPGFIHHKGAVLNDSTVGFTLMPKGGCDVQHNEIQRIYSLSGDQGSSIKSYGYTVPRRTAAFAPELFPDTLAPIAAQDSKAYLAGTDVQPVLEDVLKVKALLYAEAMAELKAQEEAEAAKKAAAEQEAAVLEEKKVYKDSDTRKAINKLLKTSIYKHCRATEPPSKEKYFYDLKEGKHLSLGRNVKASRNFFATTWKTASNSAIAIFRHQEDLGRAPIKKFCVRGHTQMAIGFEFNPFDDNELVTAGSEGSVKFWEIPLDGLTEDLNDPVRTFQADGKVTFVGYHPLIQNLVVVGVAGFGGAAAIQFVDSDECKCRFKVELSSQVIDVAFHNGCKQVLAACKDGVTRLIDPFNSDSPIVSEFNIVESKRDYNVIWTSAEHFVSMGFGAASKRSISLWNVNQTEKPVQRLELARSSNMFLPVFDWDSQVLFLAEVGGRNINTYQIDNDNGTITHLSLFKSNGDSIGFCALPKMTIDVKKVEILKTIKLSKTICVPQSWTVPRKRKEFFQDDLFPPTRNEEPLLTCCDWADGYDVPDATFINLQPSDMTPLSEAPEEAKSKHAINYANRVEKEEEPEAVGCLGHSSAEEVNKHFSKVAQRMPKRNRWDAAPISDDDSDSDWD